MRAERNKYSPLPYFLLVLTSIFYDKLASAEGSVNSTIVRALLEAGKPKPLCEELTGQNKTLYGWVFFTPKDMEITISENESFRPAQQGLTMKCKSAPEQWYLYGGFFVDEESLTQGKPWMGMRFKNNPASTGDPLQAIRKFLNSKVLNKEGIKDHVSAFRKYDHKTGKLIEYGFRIKTIDQIQAIATMHKVADRIAKKITEANSEHACPLSKAICDFEAYEKDVILAQPARSYMTYAI